MKSEIEAAAQATPFVASEIRLVAGGVLRIRNPDFVYVPPGRGMFLVYTHRDGTAEMCKAMLVDSIRPMRDEKQRRAG